MALFPQFPYSNLHELNLDWLIEQISQLMENGTVISVNGMSGIVTLYTEKDVVFPDRATDPDWSVYRRIADKHAGLKFTGEKFYYITKNIDDEDFTIQEVFTSANLPPFPVTSVNGQTGDVIISVPVTSVNGRTGNVMLAGDNIPYNIDGSYTIEDVIIPLEQSIGHVIRYNTCSESVTAGQYVYLILSGISGRDDGLYQAVNSKSAGTVWTTADLAHVAGGLGSLIANLDNAIDYDYGQYSNIIEAINAIAIGMPINTNRFGNFLINTTRYTFWIFQSGVNYYTGICRSYIDNTTYLVRNNNGTVTQKTFVPLEDIPDATTSASGLMSATDKTKLDGIEAGAQVNPGNATQLTSGLMSNTDKIKLDGIQSGANIVKIHTDTYTFVNGTRQVNVTLATNENIKCVLNVLSPNSETFTFTVSNGNSDNYIINISDTVSPSISGDLPLLIVYVPA